MPDGINIFTVAVFPSPCGNLTFTCSVRTLLVNDIELTGRSKAAESCGTNAVQKPGNIADVVLLNIKG